MRRWGPPATLLLLLLGAWQLYSALGPVDALVLPAPSDVASALWTDRALLSSDLTVTASEALLGLLIALTAALALASAIHAVPIFRRAAYPLLIVSQTIPILILAPLLVIWLGLGAAPKLAIVALVSFFPIVIATLDGLAAVEPALLKMARTLGANRRQAFLSIEAPSAVPALFTGLKVAVAWAVVGAAFAEYSAPSIDGLGHLILQATGQLDTARAYAGVVLLSALALALFGALALAERRLIPWARRPAR
jgi:ABC-type nitrate/sulfonate/bicarbonate transport system permease component